MCPEGEATETHGQHCITVGSWVVAFSMSLAYGLLAGSTIRDSLAGLRLTLVFC